MSRSSATVLSLALFGRLIPLMGGSLVRSIAMLSVFLSGGLMSACTGTQRKASPTSNYAISSVVKDIKNKISTLEDNSDAITAAYILAQDDIQLIVKTGRNAIPILDLELKDSSVDWKVKALLLEALAEIQDPATIPLLKQIFFDESLHFEVRAKAGHVIGALNAIGSADLVKRIVEDNSIPADLRSRVMGALTIFGFEDVEWLKKVVMGDFFEKNQERLTLKEGAGIMWNAMRALGTSKNPRATDVLIELQEKFITNDILTEALKRRGERKAIPILIKVMNARQAEKTTLSRETAAQALGELRADDAVPHLIRIIEQDKDPLLITRAAEALGDIGAKDALPQLEILLKGIEDDARFRGENHRIKLIRLAVDRLKS